MSDLVTNPNIGKSKSWLNWGVTLTLVGVTAIIAYMVPLNKQNPSNRKLIAPEELLDLGEVWETKDFTLSLPITNVSNTDLKITGFAASCGCFTFTPNSFPISAGETRDVAIGIDLTRQQNAKSSEVFTNLALQIAPIVKDDSAPLKGWTIRGKVRKLYQIDPPSIDFGIIPEGQSKSMTVLVVPQRSLSGLMASSSSDQFAAEIEKADSKQNKYQVRVSSQKRSSPGPISSDLILRGVDDTGKPVPAISVHVRGLHLADIQINPPTLLFGLRPVGKKTEGTVVIQSRKGENLTFVRAESDSPDIQVEQISATNGGGGISLRVIQDVRQPGVNKGTITFTMETGKKKLVRRTMDVTCDGI